MQNHPPRVKNSFKKKKTGLRFYGYHAVTAALANPCRKNRKIWLAPDTKHKFNIPDSLETHYGSGQDLARLLSFDVPHQGVVLDTEPLESPFLGEVLDTNEKESRPLIVLDQVTDPHNVGAILRSAAAFGALALITQDRHSPPESGALAKAASGALEYIPWVRVVNLARALEEIAQAGFWRIGLEGQAVQTLGDTLDGVKPALILGAEGQGLRQNTASHCDQLACLPITNAMESLNVSNAAAIALYACATSQAVAQG